MITFQYVITDKAGMHARPAGILVQTAVKLGSSITIGYNGNEADCKKLIALMRLGVKHGGEVEFRLEGESEAADAEVIKAVLAENL